MRRSITVLSFLALSVSAFADTVAWDAIGNGTNQFGSLDLNNGNFSLVSNLGFTPDGLGEIGQTLYTAASGGTGLYTVNTKSGATSLVGNLANQTYYVFGSTTTGLYMVDTVGELYNINPATGVETAVGSTHLLMGSNTVGLSTGSNNLYISLGANVYSINTSTGLASYLGTSGSTDFGALVSVGGTVYGSSIVSPNSIYTFNPSNGISTFSTLSSAPDYAWGLAPIVPEPSSFALLGLGLTAGLAVYARKRKRA